MQTDTQSTPAHGPGDVAAPDRPLRMAIDVGGTFTDVCVFDGRTGSLTVSKVPTTKDPISGVLEGAAAAE